MREVEMKYPTGVENHGGKLRIWFVYKGVRVRENLGVPDTAKNRGALQVNYAPLFVTQ